MIEIQPALTSHSEIPVLGGIMAGEFSILAMCVIFDKEKGSVRENPDRAFGGQFLPENKVDVVFRRRKAPQRFSFF